MSTTTIYVKTSTREKLKTLADLARRDLVEELDCIADRELKKKGIDPQSLEAVAKDDSK